ncbi:MAG: thioesterase family protein [Terriglobales bacterium]
MPKPVPTGARAEVEEIVELKHTLTARNEALPPVMSTPNMIEMMEMACFFALQPFAEGDEITVGTHINVRHTAACGVGAKVKAEAVMESFDGRFYLMRCRAWAEQGGKTFDIGDGTVGRAFVSVGQFVEKMKARGVVM